MLVDTVMVGSDVRSILRALLGIRGVPPLRMHVRPPPGSKPTAVPARVSWDETIYFDKFDEIEGVDWGDDFLVLAEKNHGSWVRGMFDLQPHIAGLFKRLTKVPFTVASFSNSIWDWEALGYSPGLWGGAHGLHGWGFALRGEGHKKFVSRRWLTHAHGWRLLRDEETDTSLVQFCDVCDPDPWETMRIAWTGHELAGYTDTGGYVTSSNWPYQHDLRGLYITEQKQHRIIVNDREVIPREMLDAVAFKRERENHPTEPIESVSFIFVDEEWAQLHLHDLWLRELECWAIIEGREVRLDEDYHPDPPPKEPWVAEVEEREARESA